MVYRGGLENRFGLTANGGSNPSLSAIWLADGSKCRRKRGRAARQAANFCEQQLDSNYYRGGGGRRRLWLLWWQGQIQRLAVYVAETREELKKCAWPNWEELKGPTALIMIMIALLGGFIVLTT